MKPIQVTIDDQSLNARHFAGMTEAEAVKALIADGLTSDEAWAKKAYKLCVDAVKKADAPPPAKA